MKSIDQLIPSETDIQNSIGLPAPFHVAVYLYRLVPVYHCTIHNPFLSPNSPQKRQKVYRMISGIKSIKSSE